MSKNRTQQRDIYDTVICKNRKNREKICKNRNITVA